MKFIKKFFRFSPLLFGLLLAAGCNSSASPGSSAPDTANACKTITGTATMLLKDGSFDPQTLTVKQCTKVVFQNVGQQPHWPASDLHPTHGIYPEFDPQANVDPGQTWSFVFDRIGHWRCHDHLNPSVRCEVDVNQ